MILLALPLLIGMFLIWRMPRWPSPVSARDIPVSIIIPARNEEHNIGLALESLSRQTVRPLEVLVVDDHSEDATAAVARRSGAEVLNSPPLPQGWRGKTWACRHGACAAKGDVLLFMDADVRLRPDALGRIWEAYRAQHAQVLSLGPYHVVERAYEELSVVFNIFTYAGMGSFTVCGSAKKPQGLFGPFLLIDRGVYFDTGGHEPVKSEILENMSLCPLLAERGIRMLCMPGRGVADIRMYPAGLAGLIEGWTKAFAVGADKTSPAIMTAAVVWTVGALLTAILLPLLAEGVGIWLLYGAYALGFYWMAQRVGSFSPLTAMLYPLPLLFYLTVFTRSLIFKVQGRAVSWKGRSIGASS